MIREDDTNPPYLDLFQQLIQHYILATKLHQNTQEYAWVNAKIYQQKRREVLTAFYQQQPLYQTRYFQQTLEQQAKYNLLTALLTLFKKSISIQYRDAL